MSANLSPVPSVSSTSIRIDQLLYEQAKVDALAEHRTISGQIEFWAKIGRAALDNPDLPVAFIAESLASLAEPRELATPFIPKSAPKSAPKNIAQKQSKKS